MTDQEKKYEHLVSVISDKIRVLNLEIIEETEVSDFWLYQVIYVKEDKIMTEHVIGRDMSDALYRLSKILEMPLTRFPSFLKNQ